MLDNIYTFNTGNVSPTMCTRARMLIALVLRCFLIVTVVTVHSAEGIAEGIHVKELMKETGLDKHCKS